MPAALSLGQIYLEQKEPEKAVQVLRDLVSRVPQQRVAYALLIEALLRADRGAEAEAALQEVLAFDPASLGTRLALAEMQSDRGDHEAALATLQAAPEEGRDEPRVRRKLAWELYSTGDLDAALATLEGLLAGDAKAPRRRCREDPEAVPCACSRGWSCRQRGATRKPSSSSRRFTRPSRPTCRWR